MIKAEVVFDEDDIHCNGYRIQVDYRVLVFKGELCINNGKSFKSTEEAIKYCMEN